MNDTVKKTDKRLWADKEKEMNAWQQRQRERFILGHRCSFIRGHTSAWSDRRRRRRRRQVFDSNSQVDE